MGEAIEVLVEAVGPQCLQGLAHRAVDLRALPLEQSVVRDILGQGVLEAVTRRREHPNLLDQPQLAKLVQVVRQIGLVTQRPLEDVPAELASDHRSAPDQPAGHAVEAVEPRAQDALHRVGQLEVVEGARDDHAIALDPERPLLRECVAHLLEKKGIAAGPVVQEPRERRWHLPGAHDGPDDDAGVVGSQRPEHDRGVVWGRAEPELALGTRRHHDEQRVCGQHLEDLSEHVA